MISSSSWTPVGMCRPGARARSSRSARGRCRAHATGRATRAAVHPLRHLAEAEAVEVRETEGEEHGAFTAALLAGLRGAGAAKAWSGGTATRCAGSGSPTTSRCGSRRGAQGRGDAGGALLQIPQDTGSRGVAGRPRDVAVTSFADDAFPKERLEVLLDPDTAYATADVRVIDGLGDVVAGQVGGTGSSVVFYLPPKTYALRAAEPELGEAGSRPPSSCTRLWPSRRRSRCGRLKSPSRRPPRRACTSRARRRAAARAGGGAGLDARSRGAPRRRPDPARGARPAQPRGRGRRDRPRFQGRARRRNARAAGLLPHPARRPGKNDHVRPGRARVR